MIQKLMVVLLVTFIGQLSGASDLDSEVSFSSLKEAEAAFNELNQEVGDLIERIEILEGNENSENFERRRTIYICTAGPATATSAGSSSMARAKALSKCKRMGGRDCHRIRCQSVRG